MKIRPSWLRSHDVSSPAGRREPRWRLEDEWEITRLLTHYCRLLDSDVERIANEIFVSDGVADYQGHVVNGRKEIGDYLEATIPKFDETAHLNSDVWVHTCDGHRAEVTSSIIVWHWWSEEKLADGLTNFVQIVHNTDRLVCTSEGWRIAHRRTVGVGTPGALGDAHVRADLIIERHGHAKRM